MSRRRRNELVEAGLAFFGQRAYHDIEMSELCDATGISEEELHRCFGSKREFFVATLRHAVERLMELTTPKDRNDPMADLEHQVAAYFDYLCRHPQGALAVTQHADASAEIEALLEPFRARTRAGLARALHLEHLDPHVDLVLWSWSGLLDSIATRLVTGSPVATLTAARLAALALIQLVEESLRLRGDELPHAWQLARQRLRQESAH